MKKTFFLGFTALLCGLSVLSAQVTIGADSAPQDFSVLELVSGNNKGLRLPQIETTAVRDAVSAAHGTNPLMQGLQIFNMQTKCVEVWNGVKWISIGAEPEPQYAKCTVKSTLRAEGLTFMCYNLGADPNMSISDQMAHTPDPGGTASTDATVYGHLYQWGRVGDGHQQRNSTAVAGPYTGTFNNGQIPGSATAYYGKYVWGVNGTNYDWRSPQSDVLWGNPKTANDPCPAGWRVPTATELQSVFNGDATSFSNNTSWVSVSSGNKVRWSNGNTKGLEISADGGSTTALFLPAAGYRGTNSSTLNYAGTYGYYWSSTVNGTSAYNLYFYSSLVSPGSNSTRANGFSVRCLSEY